MQREYEEAFAEVDEIFKIMPSELLIKVPIRFRQIISENKAKDYNIIIQEPLENQKLKKETIVVLGLIYRDFLASPEEREELQLRDAQELKRIEQQMQEQCDIQNIFEKRKAKKEENNFEDDMQYTTDLTLYKEPGFLKKFFNLIKGIFKKNKF